MACSTQLLSTAEYRLIDFICCSCLLPVASSRAFHMQAVAQECGISAMPTFQVWKGSQKVDELVGASKDKLQALVEKYAS